MAEPGACTFPCTFCNDPNCLQCDKHWCCGMHPLHLGDNVTDTVTGKQGYIYDANPYSSKRSVYVRWYPQYQDKYQGKLFIGSKACTLVKTGGKTTEKISSI